MLGNMSNSTRKLTAGVQPTPSSPSSAQFAVAAQDLDSRADATTKVCSLRGLAQGPTDSRCKLGTLSFALLIACPALIALGLVIYVLPVVLFMISGGGSMNSFGELAQGFTIPSLVALGSGVVSLVLAAIGYFVVLFKVKTEAL